MVRKFENAQQNLEQEIYMDIRSGANIINGDEYRVIVSSLAKVAAESVVKTLGPYGATTVIDSGEIVYPTKDGWQVLKSLHFSDPVYNKIFQVLTNVSFNSAHRVGDGTTTAMCAANEFLDIMMDYMSSNPNIRQADLLGAIEEAKDQIIAAILEAPELKKIDKDGDLEDLYRVAYIASNGNDEISRMIQSVYKETGNPDIYFEIGPNTKTSVEIDDGYRFDCRPLFLNAFKNDDSGTYKETGIDVYTFIFDHPINYQEHGSILQAISTYAAQHQVLIFAPHFDDIICNMINNVIRSQRQAGRVPNIMLIQISNTTELDKGTLRDLSYMTNGQFFDYGKMRYFHKLELINSGEEFKPTVDDALAGTEAYNYETTQDIIKDCCGHICTLILSETFCIIQDYDVFGDMGLFNAEKENAARTYELLKKRAEMQTSELGREYLNAQLRFIRLSGKMGRISIGGPSNTEKRYMYDVVEDVVFACKSAYEAGIIRGLNLLTLDTTMKLFNTSTENTMLHDIYGIFHDAFFNVTARVLLNKYHDLEVTTPCNLPNGDRVDLTIRDIIKTCIEDEYGFNLVYDTFEDVDGDLSVINPVTTDIEIVKSMVSILSTIMSSSQMITISRTYDRGMSKSMQRKAELETMKKNAEATMAGQLSAINGIGLNLIVKNK